MEVTYLEGVCAVHDVGIALKGWVDPFWGVQRAIRSYPGVRR